MQSMDLEVLKTITHWLGAGHRAWLVTVVRTWGSSPRPIGSMLGIRQDGALVGSVSGGCIEDDLIERVRDGALAAELPQTVSYGVSRAESQRYGLPCGGTLQLVVEPWHDGVAMQQVLDTIENGLIVSRRLHLENGRAELLPATSEQELTFDSKLLTTVYGPRWRLLIIGAGQVSRYLAEMAPALDYQVTVCDPRDEYLQSWEVPNIPVVRQMPDDLVKAMVPDRRTAIACLTHDPKLDDMALLEALVSDAFYVGAIGSQRNTAKRRERMALFDIGADQIARLHGPIGIPIGSKTPSEIAVSILAEMTAIKRGAYQKCQAELPRLLEPVT